MAMEKGVNPHPIPAEIHANRGNTRYFAFRPLADFPCLIATGLGMPKIHAMFSNAAFVLMSSGKFAAQ